MPECGCKQHDIISEGESSPVLKIANKKIKKDTINKLREKQLIGPYSSYVCEKCVRWVESGNDSKGLKRKGTTSMCDSDDVISEISKGTFSENELKSIASAIGSSISDSIFNDSQCMSDNYVNPDNLTYFNVDKWLNERNSVLTSFLCSCANIINKDSKKMLCITSAVESVYKARNMKTVSPFAFSTNLVAYYISHSKNVVSLFNSCRPAGSYFALTAWLKKIGTTPLSQSELKSNDCMVFFDNSQVIARNWRVNYNYKSKASVITTTANFIFSTKLQSNASYSPRKWLYASTAPVKDIMNNFMEQNKNSFARIRNEFLHSKLGDIMKNSSFDNGALKDIVSRRIEDEPISPVHDKEPYEWVPSKHIEPQPDISIGEPIMANPCSYESVERVMKEIRETCAVNSDAFSKAWCILGCDGLPYTLGSRLIEKNKDMQNILLIPGQGHIEMNVVKAAFKLLWEPILQDLSKECGFKSPRAQVCAQSCSDHHKAFMLLEIMFESTIQELLTTFVLHCCKNSKFPSVSSFFDYIKVCEDRNYRFMCDVILNYILPIFVYRAGMRRNNFLYISAAKSQFFKLFFAFGMKNYQQLIVKDIKTYALAPQEVKEFLQKTQSFTVSGHPSKGEGGDFILEALNGKIKRWLPPGIPEQKHWQHVCRNADLLDKIRGNTLKACSILEDRSNYVYKRDISKDIVAYRMRLRKLGYLSNNQTIQSPHTSVTGEFLDRNLYLFESQIQENVECFLKKPEKAEFTPVFTTESQRSTFHSIEKKTKKQLSDMIEAGLQQIVENGDIDEACVLRNMWSNVKSRTKQEMIHFYKEIVAAIENSTAYNQSDDDSSAEEDAEECE